jgi:LysM repeat protein
MIGRSEWLSSPFRHGNPDRPGQPPLVGRWSRHLWLGGLLVAVLVAGLAVIFRPAQHVRIERTQPLSVAIALPAIGAGAPQDLVELQAASAGPSVDGAIVQSSVAVTARRYGAHLVADLLAAPTIAVPPLPTADEIQAAVASAMHPVVIQVQPLVDGDFAVSESLLAARLGLAAGEPLPPYVAYDVQRGDTVEKLAQRFGLAIESILFNNFEIGQGELLQPGGQLTIPTQNGVVYTVRLGDTLFAIAENFAADVDDILAFEGNNLLSADRLVEGSTLLLVGGSASVGFGFGASGPVFAIPEFRWPMGGSLTDFYGSPRGNRFGFHTGIDLSAPTGTFIGSAAPGIVVQTGWDGSFGNTVLVDHGGGVLTRYAHMDHIDVFLGATVDSGTLLGFVGTTGYSTGPHLHFEIIMGGVPQDPLIWLNS